MAMHATSARELSLPQASSSLDASLTHLAGQWFLGSGIQEANGGVARYYHSDTRRNARVSTEITGYAVSTLVFLYERTRSPEYLKAAIQAGQFLVGAAWSPSLKTFPFEHSRDGDAPQPLTYFFDCGIIIRGLLALWRVTGEQEYLDVAAQTGHSMARDFATGNTWHPILDLPGKYPLQWTSQWSRQPGCYQLKSALAWHDLGKITNDSDFDRYFEAALATALATHDTFLPAETPAKTMDRLHAYCYFLEALLASYRPAHRIVIAQGITRVSGYLREIRSEFERSDVNAQLLRVRLLASSVAGLPLNDEEASEEAAAIVQFQLERPGGSEHGGFWFGRKEGEMLPFLNPVSTAFCLQAYEWWQDQQIGRSSAQAII